MTTNRSAKLASGFTLAAMLAWLSVMAATQLATATGSKAAAKMPVLATFSILADLARNVGGDRVEVVSLVQPGGDAHVFQPTPGDAAKVRSAKVVIENGLGLEGWMGRLVEASGYKGEIVVASEGVKPLSIREGGHDHGGHHHGEHKHEHGDHDHEGHDHDGDAKGHEARSHAGHHHGRAGEADPHVWHDLDKARDYVSNITRGFCNADKAGCPEYKANAAAYLEKMQALDDELTKQFAEIPEAQRKIITSHDAFGYLANRYHIEIHAPEGVTTETEASAKDIAAIIGQIRRERIKALFVENISDPRVIEQIARETGLKPAGELYSDSLSASGGVADSYLKMMRYNATQIIDALKGAD